MDNFNSNGKYRWLVILIAVAYFFVASIFVFTLWLPQYAESGQAVFNWPDAMANFSFIKSFITDSQFQIPFAGNVEIQNIVHPRSVNVFAGNIVPMSFLGQILLFGVIGKIIGIYGVFFLTPLMASLAVYYFYRLIFQVFKDELVGVISAVLLATLAAFVYYSMLVMLHAVLFLALLIIGFWVLVKDNKDNKPINQYFSVCSGGLLIGLALAVRTVEAPWVLMVVLILFLVYRLKRWRTHIPLFILGLIIAFTPILVANNSLYGEPLTLGYLKMEQSGDILDRLPNEFQVHSRSLVERIAQTVFLPFGWIPKNILKVGYYFLAEYYWPYLILAAWGVVGFLLQKKKKKDIWVYLGVSAIICLWLIMYYGNWRFDDNDVLKYASISSSYMRYFLPIYIVLLPGVAYSLTFVTKSKSFRTIKIFAAILLLTSVTIFSTHWALYGAKNDGLIHHQQTITEYYDRFVIADGILSENSIILTDRTDKYFFPKYQVVVFQLNYEIFPQLIKIIDDYPLYYMTVMPDKDISFINQEKIYEYGLIFHQPIKVDETYRLFKLDSLENFTKIQK